MVYIFIMIFFRRFKLIKLYRIIEILFIEVKLGDLYVVVFGLYRFLYNMGVNYYEILEDELNEVIIWVCF